MGWNPPAPLNYVTDDELRDDGSITPAMRMQCSRGIQFTIYKPITTIIFKAETRKIPAHFSPPPGLENIFHLDS